MMYLNNICDVATNSMAATLRNQTNPKKHDGIQILVHEFEGFQIQIHYLD